MVLSGLFNRMKFNPIVLDRLFRSYCQTDLWAKFLSDYEKLAPISGQSQTCQTSTDHPDYFSHDTYSQSEIISSNRDIYA